MDNRNEKHGWYMDTYETAVETFNAINPSPNVLDVEDAILFMMCMKLARNRQSDSYNRDNIIDAINYLAMYDDLVGTEEE